MISGMFSFFLRIGIWHEKGEEIPTLTQLGLKLFYCICYMLYPISFLIGAITKETLDESAFLLEGFMVVTVLTVKIFMLVWKQKQIMQLLHGICVFSMRHDEESAFFNDKMEKFIKFVVAFSNSTIVAAVGVLIFPFIGKRKTFIVDLAFPLDWKTSEIGFWTAYIFYVTEMILTCLAINFSVIIWYLFLNCSLRYKILGAEIRNMGRIPPGGKKKLSEKQQHAIFYQDLVDSIESHLYLRKCVHVCGLLLILLFIFIVL